MSVKSVFGFIASGLSLTLFLEKLPVQNSTLTQKLFEKFEVSYCFGPRQTWNHSRQITKATP